MSPPLGSNHDDENCDRKQPDTDGNEDNAATFLPLANQLVLVNVGETLTRLESLLAERLHHLCSACLQAVFLAISACQRAVVLVTVLHRKRIGLVGRHVLTGTRAFL